MITKLAVVAPVYNEESVIEAFYQAVIGVLNKLEEVDYRIIFVLDRSTDNTLAILRKIAKRDVRVQLVVMSARFGQQASLLAGISSARDFDAIVMMDSDLQHPPELIPKLLECFCDGVDVVYTVRKDTKNINSVRRLLGNIFYALLNKISDVAIIPNAADFRLISKRVASVISENITERNLFLRGLISWVGFKQVGIEFTANDRFAGGSKYSPIRILKFALAGIVSFSTKPLYLGLFLGAGLAFASLIMMVLTIFNYFISQSLPSGWTTIVTLLFFFNAIQLLVIGVIGSYMGGIYEEVKMRPRYIVDERIHYEQ